MTDRLIIRADGHHELGYGHVMRTLSIAEEAIAAGLSVGYVGTLDEGAIDALDQRSITHQAPGAAWPEEVTADSFVVVDADIDDDELALATDRACALALVDDDPTHDRPAHVIVAPDLDAAPSALSMPVLVGWKHALIRSEFRSAIASTEDRSDSTLIALFGGTDPTGAGARFIGRIEELGHLRPFSSITLVEGPGSAERLMSRTVGDTTIDVVRDPSDLAQRMRTATAAITAGGTTMLELAALAIPMAVTAIVPEQQMACTRMIGAGALPIDLDVVHGQRSLEHVLSQLGTTAVAAKIAAGVHGLVDGRGAERVFAAMRAAAVPCR